MRDNDPMRENDPERERNPRRKDLVGPEGDHDRDLPNLPKEDGR